MKIYNNEGWDYRIPVEINVGGFERTDKPVELNMNFSKMLKSMGKSGTYFLIFNQISCVTLQIEEVQIAKVFAFSLTILLGMGTI